MRTITFVAFFSIILSGCAVSTQVTKPTPSTASLDRVLIVAMSNKYETRTMYEEELSYRLRDKGYNMFSSVNVDKEKRNLYTKDEILQLIDEKNIDGIITLRLKDVSSKERYTTSDRYISDMNYSQTYFFNYIDTYYNVYSWVPEQDKTVVIEANLFDAKDKSLILQVDATIKGQFTVEEQAGDITEAIAKSMAQSKRLKKKE